MIEATDLLSALDACTGPGSPSNWLRERSFRVPASRRYAQFAYEECERGDWLLWLVSHEQIAPFLPQSNQRLRLIAVDCAKYVLPLFENEYLRYYKFKHEFHTLSRSLEVAKDFAHGQASRTELDTAFEDAFRITKRLSSDSENRWFSKVWRTNEETSQAIAAGVAETVASACILNAGDAAWHTSGAEWGLCNSGTLGMFYNHPGRQHQADIVRRHVPWDVLQPVLLEFAQRFSLTGTKP